QTDGGKAPASGGLIDPFAEDEPAPTEDTQAQAKQFFEKADALYQGEQFAKAAEQYRSAYQLADSDQRGPIAFNIAQSYRLAKNFPSAVVWYQKALDIGGAGVNQYRDEIEQRLAQMQGEMKKHPETGPDGENIGEAKMLFEEAQIAYDEHDYAKAEPLYK